MLDDTDGKWPLHDGWPLQYGNVYHNSFFGYGTEPEDWSTVDVSSIQLARLQNIVKKMHVHLITCIVNEMIKE